MNKKLFLTSAIAIGFVANAYAEPSNTGSFPSDGYMQEDYTYTNAATSDNMDGVYENEVNAVAEYENVLYQIAAGKYLPAGAESVIDCDQNGYFCPGNSNGVNYSESNAQGLTQCPSGYTNSDAGAQSSDQCYRSCSGNVTIEHATAVTGFDYYGNGTDTCEPTACDNGYHPKAAVNNPDLMTLIGVSASVTSSGYVSNNGNKTSNPSEYGLNTTNDRGKFVVDYGNKGILKGTVKCSTQSGYKTQGYPSASEYNSPTTFTILTDETGQSGAGHCYCHLDSYIPYGSNTDIVLSGPWVFNSYNGGSSGCADDCARNCVNSMVDNFGGFRNALFNVYPSSPAMCEANTITINWTGATTEAINANNAGTCLYDGDVRTPQSAIPVAGKRFVGWRFVAPEPASVEPTEQSGD